MLYPGKYVIFKADEWEEWDSVHRDMSLPTLIQDCVVLRFQDIFCAPALSEYANQITTTVEVSRFMGADPDKIEKLEKLAEFFYDAAERARQYHTKKVPD